MKKISKTLSLVALCAVMVIMSVVPAFAASPDYTYIEDHSVVDCIHRYKGNDGYFYFVIKLPKDSRIINTSLAITKNSDGDELYSMSLVGFESSMTYEYSDETSNYYTLKLSKKVEEGIGIKLYHYTYGSDICYMATDTANGSTTEGRGYWLSA